MKYLEWIKESKTYICPKTGIYKIICVGGGSSGCGIYISKNYYLSHDGKTTSFGNFISADGASHNQLTSGFKDEVSGQGGYDGINYGSSPFGLVNTSSTNSRLGADSAKSFDKGTGHGFGAGGGAISGRFSFSPNASASATDVNLTPTFGYCGKMESTIIDLTEGQSIPCTVGKGGSNIFSEDEIKTLCVYGTSYKPENIVLKLNVDEVVTLIANTIGSGADGVIIVQYLGSEM